MMPRTRAWLIVAVLMSISALGWAQDFDTRSGRWNGLSEFEAMLQARAEVKEGEFLWSEVRASDAIVVIYPQTELDVSSFGAFLVDGGRLLLADDFGTSTSLLDRLSIHRAEPAPQDLRHQTFVADDPGWPVIRSAGHHPLIEDVEEVVGNYPAVLFNVGGPVLGYEEEGGFVYDMVLGEGRAVVVADPALFLNGMLDVADNRVFAQNGIEYLCEGRDDCRIWLLIGAQTTLGRYGSGGATIRGDALLHQVQELNVEVRQAFMGLPGTGLLYYLAIFLVIGTTAYLLTVFSWRKPGRLSERMHEREREFSVPMTEFDWNVERYGEEKATIDYLLPAAIMKEELMDFFQEVYAEGETSVDFRRVFDRGSLYRGRESEQQERKRKIEELLTILDTLPARTEVFLGTGKRVTRTDLMAFHHLVMEILEWMGLQEDYERRTGTDRHFGRR